MDGVMKCTPNTTCGAEYFDSVAGLTDIELASSAAAAPPANALPRPLALSSCSANAAPNAWPAPSNDMAAMTPAATRLRRNWLRFMMAILLVGGRLALHDSSFAKAPAGFGGDGPIDYTSAVAPVHIALRETCGIVHRGTIGRGRR